MLCNIKTGGGARLTFLALFGTVPCMLKIRFQRTGRKNDPAFRIVVTEHTSGPKAGKSIETVGSYHPKTKHTVLDADAVKKWLSLGAQASGTVHNLLISKGIIEGKKVNVLGKKTPIVKDEPKEEVKAEAPAPEESPAEAPTEEEVVADTETDNAPAEEAPAADAENSGEPKEEKKEEEAPAA